MKDKAKAELKEGALNTVVEYGMRFQQLVLLDQREAS